MKHLTFLILLLTTINIYCQTDTIQKLSFSGFAELYYSYDFSNPSNHEKNSFFYNHKRHNEINANIILGKAAYNDNSLRANFALMVGNYAHYNLSNEPTWAQFVYEANIGFKIAKKQNIWVDIGIMPSHIGFESAINTDCWTLTRSFLAENSPYYETGLKINYSTHNNKLSIVGLLLNGWQHVKKPDYIQTPSIGFQINYKPNKQWTFNYSNFIGTDKPDTINAVRIFHNIFVQYEPTSKIGIIGGFDIGTDKYNNTDYAKWYSVICIARYNITSLLKIGLRGEYYNDLKQIIISTNTTNGFKTISLSSNIDYAIHKNLQFRIEGRFLGAKDKLFKNNTQNNNFMLTSNLSLKI